MTVRTTRTRLLAFTAALAIAAPALAQTTTTTPGSSQGASQQGAMRPLAAPQPNQMLGSDVRGTTVYGANNENIGPVNDVLLDRDGRVAALIVGVGGFLGLGQKDVAVPFQAFEFEGDANQAASARTGADATGAVNRNTGTTGSGMTGTGTTGTGSGTTGTGMTGTGAAGSNTRTSNSSGTQQATIAPQRIVLRGMTRADLESAPAFRSDGTAR